VITSGLEMSVIGTLLLPTVDRDLRAIHVQHDPLRRINRLALRDQLPIDGYQTVQVFFLRQHFGLEPVRSRSQRRTTLPVLGITVPQVLDLRAPASPPSPWASDA
jgi:hypothetical protein